MFSSQTVPNGLSWEGTKRRHHVRLQFVSQSSRSKSGRSTSNGVVATAAHDDTGMEDSIHSSTESFVSHNSNRNEENMQTSSSIANGSFSSSVHSKMETSQAENAGSLGSHIHDSGRKEECNGGVDVNHSLSTTGTCLMANEKEVDPKRAYFYLPVGSTQTSREFNIEHTSSREHGKPRSHSNGSFTDSDMASSRRKSGENIRLVPHPPSPFSPDALSKDPPLPINDSNALKGNPLTVDTRVFMMPEYGDAFPKANVASLVQSGMQGNGDDLPTETCSHTDTGGTSENGAEGNGSSRRHTNAEAEGRKSSYSPQLEDDGVPAYAFFPLNINERDYVLKCYEEYGEEMVSEQVSHSPITDGALYHLLEKIDDTTQDAIQRLARLKRCLNLNLDSFPHSSTLSSSHGTESSALQVEPHHAITEAGVLHYAGHIKFIKAARQFENDESDGVTRVEGISRDEGCKESHNGAEPPSSHRSLRCNSARPRSAVTARRIRCSSLRSSHHSDAKVSSRRTSSIVPRPLSAKATPRSSSASRARRGIAAVNSPPPSRKPNEVKRPFSLGRPTPPREPCARSRPRTQGLPLKQLQARTIAAVPVPAGLPKGRKGSAPSLEPAKRAAEDRAGTETPDQSRILNLSRQASSSSSAAARRPPLGVAENASLKQRIETMALVDWQSMACAAFKRLKDNKGCLSIPTLQCVLEKFDLTVDLSSVQGIEVDHAKTNALSLAEFLWIVGSVFDVPLTPTNHTHKGRPHSGSGELCFKMLPMRRRSSIKHRSSSIRSLNDSLASSDYGPPSERNTNGTRGLASPDAEYPQISPNSPIIAFCRAIRSQVMLLRSMKDVNSDSRCETPKSEEAMHRCRRQNELPSKGHSRDAAAAKEHWEGYTTHMDPPMPCEAQNDEFFQQLSKPKAQRNKTLGRGSQSLFSRKLARTTGFDRVNLCGDILTRLSPYYSPQHILGQRFSPRRSRKLYNAVLEVREDEYQDRSHLFFPNYRIPSSRLSSADPSRHFERPHSIPGGLGISAKLARMLSVTHAIPKRSAANVAYSPPLSARGFGSEHHTESCNGTPLLSHLSYLSSATVPRSPLYRNGACRPSQKPPGKASHGGSPQFHSCYASTGAIVFPNAQSRYRKRLVSGDSTLRMLKVSALAKEDGGGEAGDAARLEVPPLPSKLCGKSKAEIVNSLRRLYEEKNSLAERIKHLTMPESVYLALRAEHADKRLPRNDLPSGFSKKLCSEKDKLQSLQESLGTIVDDISVHLRAFMHTG